MALTDYELPTVDREFGTYKLTLQVEDNTIVGEEDQFILSVGKLIESIDSVPGIVEIENVRIEALEEYDNYSRGWWATVLEYLGPYTEDVRLKIELDEGSGYELIFWGVIDRYSTEYLDEYLSDGTGGTSTNTHRRKVAVTFVDLLYLAKGTLIGPFITEVQSHDTVYNYQDSPTDPNPGVVSAPFLSFQGIIASMVATVFGQSYALTDCVIVNDNITYKSIHGVVYYGLEDVYIVTDAIGYFESTAQRYIGNQYTNCFDYLRALCVSFGVVARHVYNGTRHTIEILARGNAYAGYVTFDEQPTKSNYVILNGIAPDGIHLLYTALAGGRFEAWVKQGELSNEQPPDSDFISFTYDENIDFNGGAGCIITDSYAAPFILYSGDMYTLNSLQYYDFESGSLAVSTRMDTALVLYFSTLWNVSRTMTRSYPTMSANDGSTTEFKNLHVLRRTQDNDGLGTKTYFARRVMRDLDAGVCDVEWVED